jgi:hypothetical protein
LIASVDRPIDRSIEIDIAIGIGIGIDRCSLLLPALLNPLPFLSVLLRRLQRTREDAGEFVRFL